MQGSQTRMFVSSAEVCARGGDESDQREDIRDGISGVPRVGEAVLGSTMKLRTASCAVSKPEIEELQLFVALFFPSLF